MKCILPMYSMWCQSIVSVSLHEAATTLFVIGQLFVTTKHILLSVQALPLLPVPGRCVARHNPGSQFGAM